VAAEHGGLIKKKKERKKTSWVKLKAFPTNVGRFNNVPIECGSNNISDKIINTLQHKII